MSRTNQCYSLCSIRNNDSDPGYKVIRGDTFLVRFYFFLSELLQYGLNMRFGGSNDSYTMCSSPEATVRLYTTQNERNMVLHSIHISFPRNELNVVNKYPLKENSTKNFKYM